MERIRTVEVEQYVGQRVQLCGWLHAIRRLGGINFLVLRDGWGLIQAVTEDEGDVAPIIEQGLGVETVIALEGTVVQAAQAPDGYELHSPRASIITPNTDILPAPLYKPELRVNLPTLLDHAVVLNRHPRRRAIFRLAARAMHSFRASLDERNFTEIQTPKLVATATESGASVFRVDYFGRQAYLAQSPQFYKQIMVGVFERVYEVGPVFRAEAHDTSQHANEYVSLDAEFGFIDDHFDVMSLVQEVLTAIFQELEENCARDLSLLEVTVPEVPGKIPHVHFTDAQELIWKRQGVDVRGEADLSTQDERWLGEWAQELFGSEFLFVTGYPMVKRPFYTHADPSCLQYSNSFDLLYKGTELITGGQRLHRYEDYVVALGQAQLSPEPFASYLEAFRFGMPPHGGFAIGLERLLMQLTGYGNLRLTTLFPRDLTRLTP